MKASAICLSLLLSAALVRSAFGGTGWHVTVHNNSKQALRIVFAGNDGWYCNEFCGDQQIAAETSTSYYTEEKYQTFNPGIQGIDILSPLQLTLAHVEFWNSLKNVGHWSEHEHNNGPGVLIKAKNNGSSKIEFIGISNPSFSTELMVQSSRGIFGTVYADIYIPPFS